MTLDEALEAAICGSRVRATNMQPGAYVDYQFNGWRINFAGGASSGWHPTDIDRKAEWEDVPIGSSTSFVMRDGWGQPIVAEIKSFGFHTRPAVELPVLVLGEKGWDEVFADKDKVDGGWADKPTRDSWGRPK